MSLDLLAISIGNTRVRLGPFHQGKLTESRQIAGGDRDLLARSLTELYAPIKDADRPLVVLASVNPPMTRLMTELINKHLQATVYRVEEDMSVPVGRQLDPEAMVGEDRLLNAAAAYDTLRQACVVVDAGTATVIDFIDGAGTFHGGAIAPGLQMMLSSLHQHTAQLPEVTLAKPVEAIGHNTVEAMRSAVYYGTRGMVRELVEQFAEVAGAYPPVIATGGNAPLLFEGYDLIDRIVPDLTLLGIGVTAKRAMDDPDLAAP